MWLSIKDILSVHMHIILLTLVLLMNILKCNINSFDVQKLIGAIRSVCLCVAYHCMN